MSAPSRRPLFKLCKNRAKFNITIYENMKMHKFQPVILYSLTANQRILIIFVIKCVILWHILQYYGVILVERKSCNVSKDMAEEPDRSVKEYWKHILKHHRIGGWVRRLPASGMDAAGPPRTGSSFHCDKASRPQLSSFTAIPW